MVNDKPKILDEEDFERAKKELLDNIEYCDDLENKEYKTGLNWIDTDKSYESLKSLAKLKMGSSRWFFIANKNEKISGKPQLIHQTKQTIPLIRRIMKTIKNGNMITEYKFIDEPYDKRYDGQFVASYTEDFWVYRVIGSDSKEYYVLSLKELTNNESKMYGMKIYLDDVSEFSKSMKIKSISRIFILYDFKPNVKIISKKELVDFTKSKKINEETWFNYLGYHPFGNINNFQKDINYLRSLFLLSGKYTGYPLHLCVMGISGTKKTMGHIETLSSKFEDSPNICEGADSRIKGLSPSFKEKPANIGYLAKCERVGWIDEIGKMIESEMNRHNIQTGNILGELNFLLEHKKRNVFSGNDNECTVQATAKYLIVTNPVSNKNSIHNHIGTIDPTTMSRILWWVQDDSEISFAMSDDAITIPPHTYTIPRVDNDNENESKIKSINTYTKKYIPEKFSVLLRLSMCGGELITRDEFLTLFDTSYSFTSDIDIDRINELVLKSVNLAREPMKSSVWKPRALHHTYLIVDGLVKHRCLFKDYDETFKAKQEDYDLAERLITRMVLSWETQFNKEKWTGGL